MKLSRRMKRWHAFIAWLSVRTPTNKSGVWLLEHMLGGKWAIIDDRARE